jgi:hypothetical protein
MPSSSNSERSSFQVFVDPLAVGLETLFCLGAYEGPSEDL